MQRHILILSLACLLCLAGPAVWAYAEDNAPPAMQDHSMPMAEKCKDMKQACMDSGKMIEDAMASLDAAMKATETGDKAAAMKEMENCKKILSNCKNCMDRCTGPAEKKDGMSMANANDEGTSTIANSKCPLMGTPLSKENYPNKLIREYKGMKIGVCCPECLPMWDKLTDEEKDAKLKAAM
jgi:hypothetical protein